jgi:hypothetical protein
VANELPEWETVREGNVWIRTHAELAALLRAAHPHFPDHIAGRRSWSYVRREVRVIGRVGRDAVATAGASRRFIEVGGQEQLVAIVGLVAAHPENQARRRRPGRSRSALRSADFAEGHPGFYRRAGCHQLPARPVRYSPDDTSEPKAFVDEDRDHRDDPADPLHALGPAARADDLALRFGLGQVLVAERAVGGLVCRLPAT